MRLLQTSDWHVGRTFHGHPTLDALESVLAAIPVIVREEGVDVVLVPGDLFDSTTPSASAFEVLSRAFRAIRDAGAAIVATSGNHDSPTRLGFQSEWAARAGVHVIADPRRLDEPVLLRDEHGEVAIYGIPYLEPALIRHLDGAAEVRTHEAAIGWAMDRIRRDAADRDARVVVLAHCFAAGVPPAAAEADDERDLTAGGLDVVPLACFEGADYVALGHLHSRIECAPSIRYSGAPLHYSFDEAGAVRGCHLIDLDADGLARVSWRDLPVPRPLARIAGELEELLADPELAPAEGAWVHARLTDAVRPLDAMRRLQRRFPWCASLEFAPSGRDATATRVYADRRDAARSPAELIEVFLDYVRAESSVTDGERALIRDALETLDAEEQRR